jgi:DNA-binding MarR family transcriptional regulator
MSGGIQQALKQAKPFPSLEEEVHVGLQLAAQRVLDPWGRYLRAEAGLTPNQYNVLRILRGSHPEGLTCSDIADRMISRDPDVTRLLDRLTKRGLVRRERHHEDRRVVLAFITTEGLEGLAKLDAPAGEMAAHVLGPLGTARLQDLRRLLEELIENLGRFP